MAVAILYRLMATVKVSWVEPFASVQDLLVQISGASPDHLSHLLPDAWLQTLPEARRG